MNPGSVREELKDIKLLIGTPCFNGAVNCEYMLGILGFMSYGIDTTFSLISNESLITRARNEIVATFLSDPSFTHLLFIDADIGFQPETILRLLSAKKPVVSAVYPRKQLNWEHIRQVAPQSVDGQDLQEKSLSYVTNIVELSQQTTFTHEGGFLKVLDAPTGFMLIERGVFDILREKYPELKYRGEQEKPPLPEIPVGEYWLFFDTMVDPNTKRYLSEDYAFCRRWQLAGGETWVDLQSPLQHIGRYNFSGDLSKLFNWAPQA